MHDFERQDLLIAAALESGLTFDLLEALSRGLDAHATAILCGNASALAQKMKSKEMLYASRSAIAPSVEMRLRPDSQFS